MNLFIAEGDDTFYDSGGKWTIGIFSSIEHAEAAITLDNKNYASDLYEYLGYTIKEYEVNVAYVDGDYINIWDVEAVK